MMNAVVVGMAAMALFNGWDLDGWITLAGKWEARSGSLVCTSAPASIRASFESDAYTLSFKYRRGGAGRSFLRIHSTHAGGGTALALTPSGPARPDAAKSAGPRISGDDWIDVTVEVGSGEIRARAAGPDGAKLGEAKLFTDRASRGFIRFEASEPGLELKDVAVREPGFTPIFDGRTLDGWEPAPPGAPERSAWVAEGGAIVCRGQKGYGRWLRTLKSYDNFVLRLEYQLPPRGNSGIYIHAPLEGRISQRGMEVQLIDDASYRGGKLKPAQLTGSVYMSFSPDVEVPCPADQWNAVEILCDKDRLRVTLNGVQLYDRKLSEAKVEANGWGPLTTRPTSGFIGFQDHTTPVRFRHIRLRELE